MSPPNGRPRLSRNLVANLVRFSSIILISFFLSPYVVHKLGAAGYGIWTLIAGLTGYLGLLDFGVRQSINKFVAHHHAVGEHRDSSIIVATGLKLFFVAGIFAFLLTLLLAWLAPAIFNIPPELLEDSRIVILLGGATVATSLICGVFGGVISGVQRFDVQCGLDVSISLLRALATVFVLHNGWGLVGMAIAHLAVSALNLLVYFLACNSLYAELKIVLSHPLHTHARKLLGFASAFFAIHVLHAIAFHSDNIVIGVAMPIEAIAFFAIAATLIKQSSGLTDALAHLMTPRISALASQGQPVGDDILNAARIATMLIVPVALTFLIRGETFIYLWMGEDYAELSGRVLRILAIVLWIGATRAVIFNSLAGLGKHRMLIKGIALEAFSNVALSILLVGSYGVVGVALGTLIPNVFVTLFYFPKKLFDAVGVRQSQVYLRAIALPSLVALPFAVTMYWVESQVNTNSLWSFFAQLAAMLLLMPLAAWLYGFTRAEKDQLIALLKR
ncbi:MAG: oligosaccharide flippase family protein [Gammaproteobacteria bacterium]|nr:oligosaccharide flippase family protein [Gammaproteobacteria bacterium]